MSIDFNADEVFEIAEQIERNGAKFYRTTAEKIVDEDKRKLLLNLAKMEDEHEQTFKQLRSELTRDEKVMTTFDPEGDSEAYLNILLIPVFFMKKKLIQHLLRKYSNQL